MRCPHPVTAPPSTPLPRLQAPERCPIQAAAEAAALHKLAALRQPPEQQRPSAPCRVAEGLYVGGAAAARNLKALRKRGITHIINASPSLPCYFKDNPEGSFTYLVVPLFDDPEAGGCCAAAPFWCPFLPCAPAGTIAAASGITALG